MSNLSEKFIVQKRNVLNELRSNSMTLQELRFFSIYLSKINPRDTSTRKVRFPLSDFQKIMGIGSDMNINHFKNTVNGLLCKIVHIPTQNGGLSSFQLFKECTLDRNEFGEWYVEIDAHDKALPLMFEFKDQYFKYELWNALRLKSSNQLRMYEILKQYEKIGKRELKVSELRELLGILPNEYPRWERFRVRVLDSCQQALAENTDISFTYERGKVGKGGKWITIIFHISKNEDYIDQLTLDEFIDLQPEAKPIDITEPEEIDYGGELADLLGSAACNDEFTPEQIRVIQDLVLRATCTRDHIAMCDYLIDKVHLMNTYKPKNRYKYLCSMIKNDIE